MYHNVHRCYYNYSACSLRFLNIAEIIVNIKDNPVMIKVDSAISLS